MAAYRAHPEPHTPRKPFLLPPELDMGFVKIEDLDFDLEREVARLRAEDETHAGRKASEQLPEKVLVSLSHA